MIWTLYGVRIADPGQVVLEAEPYRRLSYTWHSFTPELGRAVGREDAFAAADAEPRSKVTFELEPAGGAVKLTVIHDDLALSGHAAELVSGGVATGGLEAQDPARDRRDLPDRARRDGSRSDRRTEHGLTARHAQENSHEYQQDRHA